MALILPENVLFWQLTHSPAPETTYPLNLDLSPASLETTEALIATHAADAQAVSVLDQAPIALLDFAQLQIVRTQMATVTRTRGMTPTLQGRAAALEELIEANLVPPLQEGFEQLFDGNWGEVSLGFVYPPAQADLNPWSAIHNSLTGLRGRAIASGEEQRAGATDAILGAVNRLATQVQGDRP
jgi:hypothetical protein